jgi:hypothetical protein
MIVMMMSAPWVRLRAIASTAGAVVPHRQGGREVAGVDQRAGIECGIDGTEAQDLGFGAA